MSNIFHFSEPQFLFLKPGSQKTSQSSLTAITHYGSFAAQDGIVFLEIYLHYINVVPMLLIPQ